MGQDDDISFDEFIKRHGKEPVRFYVLGILVEHMHKLKRDSGDRIKALEQRLSELEAKTIAYHGIWQEGKTYAAGSVVTRSGSSWHTSRATCGTPGGPLEMDRAWTLMVKRGADGRDTRS